MFSVFICFCFSALRHFSAQVFIFWMLMLFFLSLLFLHSALVSQMLRLEFHVNQRGLKRHHWSTSSWLTAPPLANQSTSLQCASLAADAQRGQRCSHVKRDNSQMGNIFPYRTPLYVSVCHCSMPGWRSVYSKQQCVLLNLVVLHSDFLVCKFHTVDFTVLFSKCVYSFL